MSDSVRTPTGLVSNDALCEIVDCPNEGGPWGPLGAFWFCEPHLDELTRASGDATPTSGREPCPCWDNLPCDEHDPPSCRGCGRPLDPALTNVADGCPCNSPRGINHGLVPAYVCTCVACDPAQTGSVRRPAAATPTLPVECVIAGCRDESGPWVPVVGVGLICEAHWESVRAAVSSVQTTEATINAAATPTPTRDALTIRAIQTVNQARSDRWMAGSPGWTTLEVAGELAGEVGELANVCKKLRRSEMGVPGNKQSDAELREMAASEIADVFIVLMLTASKLGVDLEDAVRETFNRKSEQMGFPERIVSRTLPQKPVAPDAEMERARVEIEELLREDDSRKAAMYAEQSARLRTAQRHNLQEWRADAFMSLAHAANRIIAGMQSAGLPHSEGKQ